MRRVPDDELPTDDSATVDQDPAEDAEALVRCAGLTKVFKDFWLRDRVRAVDGVDLEVRRGEVFGLLGPNGSGKSTTIKMILGLLHPTAGRIAVLGKHPRDVANKQQIGYLPEESYLYRFLSARETLEYYGRLFHQGKGVRASRIDTLLEMVGLDKVARRPVGEFSKGMQRRIGLAQALINDPQLLILDEPTTGMDPLGTADVKRLIQQLAARGKTVLLCSHLLADVEDVCDRVAIMYGGKVRKEGPIDQLLTQDDQTTISAAGLEPGQEEQLIAMLERAGITDVRVNHPRQRLESLFLDIVHEAQQQGAATSGADSGRRKIAGFLTGEDGDADDEATTAAADTRQVLEQLQGTTPKPGLPPAEPKAPPASPPAESPRDEVVQELVPDTPEPPRAKPQAASGEPSKRPPPRDDDRGVIDDLLK
jgi:ABC-2 type transport system ATP-binding protein